MDEEIWSAYLDSLSLKELRDFAQMLALPVPGYRKEHKNTPKKILLNHFRKYPVLAKRVFELAEIRKQIRDETENKIENIKENLAEYISSYGCLQLTAALASSDVQELQELADELFDILKDANNREKASAAEAEPPSGELKVELEKLNKKLKKIEKQHKELQSKNENLQAKLEKERESWKKKAAAFQQSIERKDEELALWQSRYEQINLQVAQLETEKSKMEQELTDSCRNILVAGTEDRPPQRKRIGNEQVIITYAACQGEDISQLLRQQDYIFLQSTGLSNLLRAKIYTLCLRLGKPPLEVTGEEEVLEKLARVLEERK